MRISFLFLILSFLIVSCQKEPGNIPPKENPITLSDTVILNLAYGSDAQNKLDLYLPEKRNKDSKLIILIHGGGWSTGNKGDLNFMAMRLKSKNFVVANINYRLSSTQNADNYKMQLDDIASVISFLKTKTTFYTYGSNTIYLAGHSAGAHLALAYSYTKNQDGNIKAVAGMSSPTNLYTLSYYNAVIADPLLIPYLGGEREKIKQRYMDCSPFYQVSKTSVPTILFNGELDPVTPISQSEALIGALNKEGIANKFLRYTFAFHDWWGTPLYFDNTMDEMSAWFEKY